MFVSSSLTQEPSINSSCLDNQEKVNCLPKPVKSFDF